MVKRLKGDREQTEKLYRGRRPLHDGDPSKSFFPVTTEEMKSILKKSTLT